MGDTVKMTGDDIIEMMSDAFEMGVLHLGGLVLDGMDPVVAIRQSHIDLDEGKRQDDFFTVGGFPMPSPRGFDPDDWFTSEHGFKPAFQAWLLGRVR